MVCSLTALVVTVVIVVVVLSKRQRETEHDHKGARDTEMNTARKYLQVTVRFIDSHCVLGLDPVKEILFVRAVAR